MFTKRTLWKSDFATHQTLRAFFALHFSYMNKPEAS